MGNGFTSGRHLHWTSHAVCSALRRMVVSVNGTAVPDRLFLARSVRYNQAATQNSMSHLELGWRPAESNSDGIKSLMKEMDPELRDGCPLAVDRKDHRQRFLPEVGQT